MLFDKMGLPAPKKTQRGYSTSAEVLENLADEHRDLRADSGISQVSEAGIAPTSTRCSNCSDADGRIHTRFDQVATATGRISSAEPNLQNIPVRTELGRRDPPGVHRQTPGCSAGGRGLFADRAARAGAHVRRRDDDLGVPRGTGHPRAHGGGGLRRAAGSGDARDALGGRRRSISASSTASPISRWRRTSPSAARRRASSSSAISSAIPA